MADEQPTPSKNPVQEQGLRKEDWLLYVASFLLIGYLTYVTVDTRNSMISAFAHEDSSKRIPTEDMYKFESERNRYDYATKCLISNSMRVNLGFLAGVVISLMGSILVIRQVRDTIEFGARNGTAADAAQSINLRTTSPSVFVVFMGCVIILAAMLSKDKTSIDAVLSEEAPAKASLPAKISGDSLPKPSPSDTSGEGK